MRKKTDTGLTPSQETFAQGIARGLTQLQAYGEAYPNSAEWKRPAVATKACTLARKPEIEDRVRVLRQAVAKQAVIESADVVRELARIGFADPRQIMDAEGKMIPFHKLAPEVAAAIGSVEVDEYGRIKYKFWDKGAALDKIAKHLGMYEKDNAQRSKPAEALAEVLRSISGRVVGAGGIVVEVDGHAGS